MNTLQIVLTYQPGMGWNHAVLRNGKPMPAEDPQDHETAARALQSALVQVQQSLKPRPDDGSS